MLVGSDEHALWSGATREGDVLLAAGDEAAPSRGVADQVVAQRGDGARGGEEAERKRNAIGHLSARHVTPRSSVWPSGRCRRGTGRFDRLRPPWQSRRAAPT